MYRTIPFTALLLIASASVSAAPRDDALEFYKATVTAENAILATIGFPKGLHEKSDELKARVDASHLEDRYDDCEGAARSLATAASILAYGDRRNASTWAENYSEQIRGCEKVLKVKPTRINILPELKGRP
ncbi:hypothetical protein AB4097_17075 [Microvirga sp. 2MCAF35]|uniref:hypothetical protein n=1 Tax=Microvirga sp. 2MCAF35 TaxID=3232987 RepID=UPI003F9E2687